MSDIRARIDGQLHGGWTEASLRRSMLHAAHTFELALTERWGTGDTRAVRAGLPCDILLGTERLIRGYIDDVSPSYDAEQHTIHVIGRSRAGDLMDCSGKERQFKQRSLTQIAAELATPFGIHVRALVDDGGPFKAQTIQAGQPIWEFLEQLARIRGVLLISEPDGSLHITRASSQVINTPLVLGGNILAASGQFSYRDIFSEYTVQSQVATTFGQEPDNSLVSETVTASRTQRYRPIVLDSEVSVDAGGCRERATWERNTRDGRARPVVYTVQGWQDDDGNVWSPNRLVRVKDHYLGIDSTLLITGVQLVLDSRGRRTEIEVMSPKAMSTLALPEPTEDASNWDAVLQEGAN